MKSSIIATVVVLLLLIFVVGIFYYIRGERRRRKLPEEKLAENEILEFFNGSANVYKSPTQNQQDQQQALYCSAYDRQYEINNSSLQLGKPETNNFLFNY